jgi:hypothetical protein
MFPGPQRRCGALQLRRGETGSAHESRAEGAGKAQGGRVGGRSPLLGPAAAAALDARRSASESELMAAGLGALWNGVSRANKVACREPYKKRS